MYSESEIAMKKEIARLRSLVQNQEKNVLDGLIKFEKEATLHDFNDIFANMSDHIWKKFEDYNFSTAKLYAHIDPEHQDKLTNYLHMNY